MSTNTPSYIDLFNSGQLSKRCDRLFEIMSNCESCPRNCNVNRLKGEKGFCNSGYLPIVADYLAHFGEEPMLVGSHGSGTIFFGNCNLRCVYCQNFQISQNPKAQEQNEVTFEALADMMIELQNKGCHNINFVSPSHFVMQIIKALILAIPKGLKVPLVYNTNGYDSIEIIKLLDGIIDIYLPDAKYSDDKISKEYSLADDYVLNNRRSLKQMYRQAGDLITDEDGTARKGLIIRHLVLPGDLSGSFNTLKFIHGELSDKVTIAIMSQYYPTHNACNYPHINQKITKRDYEKVIAYAQELGFENILMQELNSPETYLPDFNRENPFEDTRMHTD